MSDADVWIPPSVRALGRLAERLRTNPATPLEVLRLAASAVGEFGGDRCIIWLVSRDGTRMRLVATSGDTELSLRVDPGAEPGAWQSADGPVGEVLGARRPIEMALPDGDTPTRLPFESTTDQTTDQPTDQTTLGGPNYGVHARQFGRFLPLWNRGRIAGVLGIMRAAGRPVFAAEDRVVLDAVAERIEAALATQDLRDELGALRGAGIEPVHGLLLRDDLLSRLGLISGDLVFRHRFGVGTDFVSAGVEHALGYSLDEFRADPGLARRLVHPEDRHLLADLVEDPTKCAEPLVVRTVARNGQVSWQYVRLVPIQDGDGRMLGVEGLSTDVTPMKRQEAELLHQARTHPLTGLANRLTFRENTARALARLERHGGMVGVLFMDLDGFKAINDTFGHAAGDTLLIEVAKLLNRVIRREDLVGHLGGDEFAVLMPELANVGEASATAQRIIDALGLPIALQANDVYVATSIGVSVTTSGAMTPDELVNRADMALYSVKRSGRGRWQVYEGVGAVDAGDSPERRASITASITEGTLRASFAAGDFRVHYLPEFDTATGAVVAVEALVRWQHPTFGLLPADLFIDAAESTEVIHALGDWVLAESCRQVGAWQRLTETELRLRVNVMSPQLMRRGFADLVLTTLAATGLAPRSLGLELSESEIASMATEVEATLDTLERAGVELIVDDFGTGSSSLRTLRRFSFDEVKIDRVLIDDIDGADSDEEREVVGLAVRLAGSLGARVVAVGVERAGQLDRLRALKCAFFQGYLAGEAQPAELIEAVLREGRFGYVPRLEAAGWRAAP